MEQLKVITKFQMFSLVLLLSIYNKVQPQSLFPVVELIILKKQEGLFCQQDTALMEGATFQSLIWPEQDPSMCEEYFIQTRL